MIIVVTDNRWNDNCCEI